MVTCKQSMLAQVLPLHKHQHASVYGAVCIYAINLLLAGTEPVSLWSRDASSSCHQTRVPTWWSRDHVPLLVVLGEECETSPSPQRVGGARAQPPSSASHLNDGS